jgi:hypothetical protein
LELQRERGHASRIIGRDVGLAVVALAACSGGRDTAPDALPDPAPGIVDLSLTALDAEAYTVPFTVGGQPFNAFLDTGSTTMAVAATACDCETSPLYTPGSAATDQDVTATGYYSSGATWSGEVYSDVVALAGLPRVPVDFVAVSSQSDLFRTNVQAILGFGPSDLLVPGTTSYLDALGSAGETRELAVRLCPDGGDLWIGGFDPSAATSAVQFTPILQIDPADANQRYYTVAVTGAAIGSADLGLAADDFGPTVIDVGTSRSGVPAAAVAAMLGAINADAGFQTLFPNQTLTDDETGICLEGSAGVTPALVDATLPPLTVEFATPTGASFAVALSPSRSYFTPLGGTTYCLGIGSTGDTAPNNSLFGVSVLSGMLTVFDVADGQIGFAPELGCAEATGDVARRRPEPTARIRRGLATPD